MTEQKHDYKASRKQMSDSCFAFPKTRKAIISALEIAIAQEERLKDFNQYAIVPIEPNDLMYEAWSDYEMHCLQESIHPDPRMIYEKGIFYSQTPLPQIGGLAEALEVFYGHCADRGEMAVILEAARAYHKLTGGE